MSVQELFPSLDRLLEAGDPAAGFDFLIDGFRAEKQYGLAFEARLMKTRFELGLPLIQADPAPDEAYQARVVEAARETGELFLAEGAIERAYPYFRAIGDLGPVAKAIEALTPGEGMDGVINIAFQEGVHPVKGIELIIAAHGMCRALTAFGMTVVAKDRDQCLALLVTTLHKELAERIGATIEAREGTRPDSRNLTELMAGRDWLFGEWDYYVDTSHLLTVVPYAVEVTDPEILGLLHELCDYGKHLSARFRSPGNPPFENQYEAYDHYALALLGKDTEEHLNYFRRKVEEADPELTGDAPARFLVKLLIALHRPAEALDLLIEKVFEDAPYGVPVPSALQLCYESKDYARMSEIAREREDPLNYAASRILARR